MFLGTLLAFATLISLATQDNPGAVYKVGAPENYISNTLVLSFPEVSLNPSPLKVFCYYSITWKNFPLTGSYLSKVDNLCSYLILGYIKVDSRLGPIIASWYKLRSTASPSQVNTLKMHFLFRQRHSSLCQVFQQHRNPTNYLSASNQNIG